MNSTDDDRWQRVTTAQAFVEEFTDKPLSGDGVEFTIHSDGRITGNVGAQPFTGNWYWSNGYFCRTATLAGEYLEAECEIIEQRDRQMRYTRDKGRGDALVVDIR